MGMRCEDAFSMKPVEYTVPLPGQYVLIKLELSNGVAMQFVATRRHDLSLERRAHLECKRTVNSL